MKKHDLISILSTNILFSYLHGFYNFFGDNTLQFSVIPRGTLKCQMDFQVPLIYFWDAVAKMSKG